MARPVSDTQIAPQMDSRMETGINSQIGLPDRPRGKVRRKQEKKKPLNGMEPRINVQIGGKEQRRKEGGQGGKTKGRNL